MKSIRPARPFRIHQTSVKALLVALLLVSTLLFQSFPLQRGGLVLAKAGTVGESNSDRQQAQNPSGDAGRNELKLSGSAAQPSRTPNATQAPNAPLAAVIVATNRDSFPNHGDGKAHENDAIDYSIAITNTGDTDATGVSFTDTVDPNTSTLVGGATVQFSVIADPYAALGNDRLDTTTIAPGSGQTVLENDTLNGSALSGFGDTLANANNVVPNGTNTVTTTNGGTVKMNANGSFIYDPAPGFGGAGVSDTFWYTLTKSTVGTGNPNGFPRGSARVTITVSAPIWFINSAAAVGGNGTLASPFNCYTGTSNGAQTCFSDTAADDPGDPIFLYNGNYIGGYALLANQKLIGQGSTASLASLTGATVPPGNTALPATNGTPSNVTITTAVAATNAIPVSAGGILLRGFTVGNTTGAKIFGSSFGTLTVGNNASPDVVLNGTGQALNLTTGIFAATSGFNSVTSTSSGTQGITLAGISGTAAFGATTISGNTTQCILVGTTTADINFGNTSCTGGTDGVSFQNNANVGHLLTFGTLGVSGGSGNAFLHGAGGGNVTVTGAATLSSNGSAVLVSAPTGTNAINFQAATSATSLTAAATGVNWAGTAGATITFNSLSIQTNAGTGLSATIGGTVNVTNGTGTINNTTQAAAAIIANAVALNANFSAINSSGGTNGVSLTTVTGTSTFGGGTLTGASGATFLVSGGTASVTYAGGITQGNNAAVVSVAGGHSGTLTFNTGTISATNGTGFQFDNADGTYNFNGTNSITSGASSGVNIQNASGGTLVFSTNTSITNPSAIAYREDTSTPTVTYGGTISKNNAANAVAINAKTGGTTNFNGGITATTTTANAINLTSNTNGTINFNGSTSTGGLNLTTSSGIGFNATGGGTIRATQNNTTIVNTITSTTGSALNVANTTIGASGLTFRSITSNGSGTANGIILDTTGSNAGLTITANGGTCSSAATCTGGTISNKTGGDGSTTQGSGIFLNSTSGVSIDRMQMNDFQNFGIKGSTVTGFSFTNSRIVGINGTTEAGGSEEGPIRFDNLFTSGAFPTAQITNSTIQGAFSVNIRVTNTSGTLNRLVIDNCQLPSINSSNTNGGSSVLFDVGPIGSGATLNWTLSNSTLSGSRASMVNVTAQGGTHMDMVLLQNKLQNANANILSGAEGIRVQAGAGGLTDLTFNISCNKVSTSAAGGAKGAGINLFKAVNSTGGSMIGTVGGNAIGVVGQTLSGAPNSAPAIWVQDHGAGTFTTLIQNNTIVEYGEEAIDLQRTSGSSTLNATVFGNTVTPNAANGFSGLVIEQGAVNTDTGTMNLVVGNSNAGSGQQNDFSNGDPFNTSDVEILKAAGAATVLNLSRNGSASGTIAQVIKDDNVNGANTSVFIPTAGSMNLVNTLPATPPAVAGCILPAIPNGVGDDAGASNQFEGIPAMQNAPFTPSEATAFVVQQTTAQTTKAPEVVPEVKQAASPVNNSSAIARAVTSNATAVPFNRTNRNDVRLAHAPGRRGAASSAAFRNSRLDDPKVNAPTTGGTVGPVALGTVTAGSSVVLTFQVTINTKAPLGAVTISNQGKVSGTNFVLVNGVSTSNPNTDDPDIGGTADPTITPIVHPSAANGTVTGRIVDDQGNPVEGAVVRLSGTQNRKFITDANGFYRFDNVETTGFYTVTPSRVNYTFNPSSRSFSQIGETTEAAFGATATGQNANPLDTPEYFVRQHYLDFLGREPDEAGFNFWSDEILGCGNDNQCIDRKRENVSAAYFLSIEFQKTGGLVDGLYRSAYGVRPDFGQFMPDTRSVGLGVQVGKDGWEATLNANKEAFMNAFVNRAAFHAQYDGMDNRTFVNTLISHTGVTFTSGERDALVSGLSTGTMTRAEALRSIAENNRFVDAKFNEAFVMMEYFGYLRRDPDSSGFAYWLAKLNQFGGNFEQAEMVRAFIVAGEYRDRFPR